MEKIYDYHQVPDAVAIQVSEKVECDIVHLKNKTHPGLPEIL